MPGAGAAGGQRLRRRRAAPAPGPHHKPADVGADDHLQRRPRGAAHPAAERRRRRRRGHHVPLRRVVAADARLRRRVAAGRFADLEPLIPALPQPGAGRWLRLRRCLLAQGRAPHHHHPHRLTARARRHRALRSAVQHFGEEAASAGPGECRRRRVCPGRGTAHPPWPPSLLWPPRSLRSLPLARAHARLRANGSAHACVHACGKLLELLL